MTNSLLTSEERAWYANVLRKIRSGEIPPEDLLEVVEELRDTLEELNALRQLMHEILAEIEKAAKAAPSPPALT